MTADLPTDHLRSLPDGCLTRAEVTILCDEIDRLASLVEKLRPYLRHDPLCANVGGYEYDCNCGLADLLAEMPRDNP